MQHNHCFVDNFPCSTVWHLMVVLVLVLALGLAQVVQVQVNRLHWFHHTCHKSLDNFLQQCPNDNRTSPDCMGHMVDAQLS